MIKMAARITANFPAVRCRKTAPSCSRPPCRRTEPAARSTGRDSGNLASASNSARADSAAATNLALPMVAPTTLPSLCFWISVQPAAVRRFGVGILKDRHQPKVRPPTVQQSCVPKILPVLNGGVLSVIQREGRIARCAGRSDQWAKREANTKRRTIRAIPLPRPSAPVLSAMTA